MQSLPKCSSRHLFLRRVLNPLLYQAGKENKLLRLQLLDACYQSQTYRSFHPLSYNAYRKVRGEYKAVRSLLHRSNFFETPNSKNRTTRLFGTTSTCYNNQTGGEQPPKKDDGSSDKDPNKKHVQMQTYFFKLLVLMTIVLWIFKYPLHKLRDDKMVHENHISWNEFVHSMLMSGEVRDVYIRPETKDVLVILHDGAVIKGQPVTSKFYIVNTDPDTFEEKVRALEQSMGIPATEGLPINYQRSSGLVSLVIMLFLIYFLASVFSGSKKRLSMDIFSPLTRAKYTLVDPLMGQGKGVRFSDVAGLKEAKIEIMEFVDYLKNPAHYRSLGAKVPRGALLLGPPGCGKTLLAKAVATEANVPFLSMNGSEFIEVIGGLGAARVRDLFSEGSKRAPSILYIDEIDAIGKKRSGSGNADPSGRSDESEQTLNQLLVEMDGMASKEGLIIIASTNRAEVLDQALLRPGRFDRHILIDLPTLEERKEIFEQHLKGITLVEKPDTYSGRMAQLTPGFSGADIANVCNEAALHAARFKKKFVEASDLAYAVDRMTGGVEKKTHAISPTEKRRIAYHEAGHALMGWLLKHTDALLKVTIVPRTNSNMGFSQFLPADRKLITKEELFDKMCMFLGGRVAESLTFNQVSTGAQNDLQRVTKMAYEQIQKYGMNKNVGLLSFDDNQTSQLSRKPYSKRLANLMDAEARTLVAEAYRKTEQVLKENNKKLELLANALLKKETLTYEEVVELIGPPPFGNKRLVDPADFQASTKLENSPPPEQVQAAAS